MNSEKRSYFFFFGLPCTALKRGLALQITKIRPRRLTTWQPGRALALFSELNTFILFSFSKWDIETTLELSHLTIARRYFLFSGVKRM